MGFDFNDSLTAQDHLRTKEKEQDDNDDGRADADDNDDGHAAPRKPPDNPENRYHTRSENSIARLETVGRDSPFSTGIWEWGERLGTNNRLG